MGLSGDPNSEGAASATATATASAAAGGFNITSLFTMYTPQSTSVNKTPPTPASSVDISAEKAQDSPSAAGSPRKSPSGAAYAPAAEAPKAWSEDWAMNFAPAGAPAVSPLEALAAAFESAPHRCSQSCVAM